jgi:hypothetical protein
MSPVNVNNQGKGTQGRGKPRPYISSDGGANMYGQGLPLPCPLPQQGLPLLGKRAGTDD